MLLRSDKLEKFCGLTGRERRILFLALLLLPTIGIGLRLFGLRRIQAALARFQSVSDGEIENGVASFRVGEVSRLVAAAGRHGFYRANCLPVSLTLGWLLRRQGISTDLRIGVRKVAAHLEAHAWVEHRGKPLIDTPEIHNRFAVFDRVIAPRKMTTP